MNPENKQQIQYNENNQWMQPYELQNFVKRIHES